MFSRFHLFLFVFLSLILITAFMVLLVGELIFITEYLWLIIGLLGIITAAVIWKLKTLPPLGRTIFGELLEIEKTIDGNSVVEVHQTSERGKPAMGALRNSFGRTKYFCKDHDPESWWMQEWMRRHGIKIDQETVSRFNK